MSNDELVLVLINAGRLRVDIETGLVYAERSNAPAKPLGAKTNKGYLRTCINYDGRQIFLMLHRVVWIAAYGLPPTGFQIDHCNGRKDDNRLSNLEAVPGNENMRRAAVSGLTRGGWRDAPRNEKGQFVGKRAAGRELDGREWNEYPEAQK